MYPRNSEISERNKINAIGDALEFFIKDSFADSYYEPNKNEEYLKIFSYLGNDTNPPDIILKRSDAIEVKKLEGYKSQLQLNSSFPEKKLHSSNTLINDECRNCEDGEEFEKDMIYAIGVIPKNTKILRCLFFVYGDCFAKSSEFYQNKKDLITNLLKHPSLDMEFSETNELGRFNDVDPLGVTNLRVRGMWLLKNPLVIFEDVVEFKKNQQDCSIFAIMKKTKFDSFPLEDKNNIIYDDEIIFKNIEIKNPDNPSEMMDAVLLRYDKK